MILRMFVVNFIALKSVKAWVLGFFKYSMAAMENDMEKNRLYVIQVGKLYIEFDSTPLLPPIL